MQILNEPRFIGHRGVIHSLGSEAGFKSAAMYRSFQKIDNHSGKLPRFTLMGVGANFSARYAGETS